MSASGEASEEDVEQSDGSGADYFVRRKVLDELRLQEVAERRTWSTKPTLAEHVKQSLR